MPSATDRKLRDCNWLRETDNLNALGIVMVRLLAMLNLNVVFESKRLTELSLGDQDVRIKRDEKLFCLRYTSFLTVS